MTMRWNTLLALMICGFGGVLRAQSGSDEGRADYVPWSGYYWPIREGAMIAGPLEKLDRILGSQAARLEREVNPPDPTTPYWHGYCHGWASAAIRELEPVERLAITGRNGPVTLDVGDQKGLLTLCHADDVAQQFGVRFSGEREDEDLDDIAPVYLWRVLKLFLGERQLPLIVDAEAGPAVWNYPVFAYRVAYEPAPEGNRYRAIMSMLLVDDEVPPDFVGTRLLKRTYYFTFQMTDGAPVLGSGRWVGPSRRNHPDFAWYPHIVRGENKLVDYEQVKQMVSRSGDGPRGGRPPTEQELAAALRPAAAEPQGGAQLTASWISPMELLSLAAQRISAFAVDITVDRFDGGQYPQGAAVVVSGTSSQAGFLHLIYLTPRGEIRVLSPSANRPWRIAADQQFTFPRPGETPFLATGDPGVYRVQALVTKRPLRFSDAWRDPSGPRLNPSALHEIKATLAEHTSGEPDSRTQFHATETERAVGELGRDEVAFYIAPPLNE